MLPYAEGETTSRLPAQGRLTASDVLQRLLSPAATLADFTQELALFSPAAILLLGELPHDPLQVWLNRYHRSDVLLGPLQLPAPIVSGLPVIAGGPDLNHVLWVCELDAWPDLRRDLCGIVGWDPTRKHLWLSRAYDLQVVDTVALSRKAVLPTVLPTVPVTFFGLDSSIKNCHYTLENQRARFVQTAPQPATVTAASTFGATR